MASPVNFPSFISESARRRILSVGNVPSMRALIWQAIARHLASVICCARVKSALIVPSKKIRVLFKLNETHDNVERLTRWRLLRRESASQGAGTDAIELTLWNASNRREVMLVLKANVDSPSVMRAVQTHLPDVYGIQDFLSSTALQREDAAARHISRAWKRASVVPSYLLCQKRLMREYDELRDVLRHARR